MVANTWVQVPTLLFSRRGFLDDLLFSSDPHTFPTVEQYLFQWQNAPRLPSPEPAERE